MNEDLLQYANGNKPRTKQEKELQAKKEQDVNPFSALLGISKLKKAKSKKLKTTEEELKKKELDRLKKLDEKGITKDNYAESVVRDLLKGKARGSSYAIYDVYKKAHRMLSW